MRTTRTIWNTKGKKMEKKNLEIATNDELLHYLWELEEVHDERMLKKVKNEINRRIKYDY